MEWLLEKLLEKALEGNVDYLIDVSKKMKIKLKLDNMEKKIRKELLDKYKDEEFYEELDKLLEKTKILNDIIIESFIVTNNTEKENLQISEKINNYLKKNNINRYSGEIKNIFSKIYENCFYEFNKLENDDDRKIVNNIVANLINAGDIEKILKSYLEEYSIDVKELNKILEKLKLQYEEFSVDEIEKIYKHYEIQKNKILSQTYDSGIIEKFQGDKIINVDLNINTFKQFINQENWKQHVSITMENCVDNLEEIDNDIANELKELLLKLKINSFECGVINETIKKKIQELNGYSSEKECKDEIKKQLKNIEKAIKLPYSKILLITGEYGTGKTYQLKKLTEDTKYNEENETYYYYIPLEIEKVFELINNNYNIIESINYYLGKEFKDLANFDRFIKNVEEKKVKIIIIIDNIDELFIKYNAKVYSDLKKYIEKLTKYDFISWIISLNRNNLFYLIFNDEFLLEYSFSNEVSEHSLYWKDVHDILNNIVNLDDINYQEEIGKQIIENYLGENYENCDNQDIINYNPMIANIYGIGIKESISNDNINEYYDFIKIFMKIIDEKISSKIYIEEWPDDKEDKINEDFKNIINTIINEKSTVIESKKFEGIRSNTEELIKGIEYLGLRKKVKENKTVEFTPNLYWTSKILDYYDKSSQDLINDISEFKNIKNDLISTYIFYIIKAENYDLCYKIIDRIIETDSRNILFLIGSKCSSEYQKYIIKKLKEKQFINLSKEECFGMMIFISNSYETVRNCCEVMNIYSQDIIKNDLTSYVCSSMNKIAKRIRKYTDLEACMKRFINCSAVEVSSIVGKVFADRQWELKSNTVSIEEYIDRVIKFIYCNCEDIIEIEHNLEVKGPQDKKTFAEYYLLESFKLLINKYTEDKMNIHEIMMSRNYYFNSNKRVSHIVRSCVTNVYGNYFTNLAYSEINEKFKISYINVIEELSSGKNKNKLKMAYHLISNSINQDKNKKQIIDKRMVPSLRKIYNNKELKTFCEEPGRANFFRLNLPELNNR